MLSLDRTWVTKDSREKRGEIRDEESKPLPAPNSRRDKARLSQILTEASRRESIYYSLLKVICEVFKNTHLRNMWRTKFYEWIKHSYVRSFTVRRLTLNTVWRHLVIIPDSLPATQIQLLLFSVFVMSIYYVMFCLLLMYLKFKFHHVVKSLQFFYPRLSFGA